jgi:AAA family ATP:ADP antiporter
VPDSAKYKAKNYIDSVVYRAGDVASGWLKAGVDAMAAMPAVAMLIGAGVCLAWAWNAWCLARAQTRIDATATTGMPTHVKRTGVTAA